MFPNVSYSEINENHGTHSAPWNFVKDSAATNKLADICSGAVTNCNVGLIHEITIGPNTLREKKTSMSLSTVSKGKYTRTRS
jgi:hypothetical protein